MESTAHGKIKFLKGRLYGHFMQQIKHRVDFWENVGYTGSKTHSTLH